MRRISVLLLLLVAPAAFAQTVETSPSSEGGRVIQSLIEAGRMDELRWPDFSDYRKHLRNFYAPLGYELAWFKNGRVSPQARTIIGLFEAADAKGINSIDYDGERWRERLRAMDSGASETARARFDLAVSATLMRYISDLHIGRINPRNIHFDLDIESKKYYLPKLLSTLKDSDTVAITLDYVEPQYDDYKRLQEALEHYRRMAAEAETEPALPVVKKLSPGDAYPGVAQLARLLKRVGDLPADAVVPASYEGALVDAVKKFQSRHALGADGVISEKTFRELNVPLSRRVKQIQWALERWRWAPDHFDAPPIVVNLPEFVLRCWDESGKTAMSMRVVVGQAYSHETPIFADEMTYVVLRPYWNVPPSIQRGEMVPKLEKDPGFLARNNYEIVSGNGDPIGTSVDASTLARLRTLSLQIRQKPGPGNALGLVKFMFPNQNNVYLHSTPSQELFSRSRRDFSHGCIRVEFPAKLAEWVLRNQAEPWPLEKIKAAMTAGDSKTIVLKERIPIMIIYTTAVVEDDGSVRFFEDIYGHDETLENALAEGYPYPA